MPRRFSFDEAYYQRFYEDESTRVEAPEETDRLVAFVCAYLAYLGQPVESVLDFGCGLGHWRASLARRLPEARYLGVELSPYLCERYGWTRGSIVDWADEARHDLVVCQGVLQYLDARAARRAIKTLARTSRGAVYLQALTEGDWAENVDRSVTDGDVFRRPIAWYREALAEAGLSSVGGGLFLVSSSPVVTFELERL